MKNPRLWLSAAALWGFAEATFFFIVPDILLTATVLFCGVNKALRLALVAALAAVVGGLLMMRWGASAPEASRVFLLSVPLIGDDLLLRVQTEVQGAWPFNLMFGAITGAPYKIYAAEAGAAEINPFAFALVSFLARLLRFSVVISLAALGFALAKRFGVVRFNGIGLAVAWGAVYAIYVMIRTGAQ